MKKLNEEITRVNKIKELSKIIKQKFNK